MGMGGNGGGSKRGMQLDAMNLKEERAKRYIRREGKK
jgi:hypothetical protein